MKYEVNVAELETAQVHGAAVARFLDDPTIKSIFVELDRAYYHQWKAAKSVEDREFLFAKASALSDLGTALQAVKDSGERATHDLQRANAQD